MTRINKSYFAFLAFAILLILNHVFFYVGHYGYDDLHYAELAAQLKDGLFDMNDHFSYRITVIGSAFLSFIFFGITDFATALPALVLSISILYLVYRVLNKEGIIAVILGLALVTLSNWFLFYSDKLMPDIFVAFSVMLSVYVIYKVRIEQKKGIIYSLIFVIALMFGFLSKGTILFIIPLLIYHLIVDLWHKVNLRFWTQSILLGVLFFASYLIVIGVLTGNPFQRFHAVVYNSYLNLCSYDAQPIGILLQRVFLGFWELLIKQGIGISLIFVIAGIKRNRIFDQTNSLSFWIITSIILMLSSNFVSVSFTSYSPMCLDPRHYLFLIPVLAIPASNVISDFIKEKKYYRTIAIVTLLFAIISFFLYGNSFYKFYLPLLAITLFYILAGQKRILSKGFVWIVVAVLFIQPASLLFNALKIDYRTQKQVFIEQVLDISDSTLVVTNEVQRRLAVFYSGFGLNHEFVSYDEFKYDSNENRAKLLFLNKYTRKLSALNDGNLPYYAKHPEENKLKYEDTTLGIALYEMRYFVSPEKNGKPLFSMRNDSKIDVRNDTLLLAYSFDSLDLISYQNIVLQIDGLININSKANADLEVKFESEDTAMLIRTIKLNKFIKAYTHWWPFKQNIEVSTSEISNSVILKIFLEKEQKDYLLLDSLSLKVYGLN